MKKQVDAFDYAGLICKAMKKGVLLTTKAGDTVNTMTIGWGKIGIAWNRPVFIAYVRETRYTKQLLEAAGEFTVNIPVGDADSRILGYCGTKSGRDTDKIADLSLTLVDSDNVQVPGIRELPLTLECKVIYKQKQDLAQLPESITDRFYPVVNEDGFRDYHIAYYGEIVNAYLIEP
ncbi:MAG: flavin reductase family protein [Oscillospiraceae bacterium]|nr:flavin reductase family protein [Oscillospiraceae bacterium]